jgi:hypothetical protein
VPKSHRERHRTEHLGWLRAAVLGANDGIRSTPVNRGSVTGRNALEGRIVHITDVASDREYTVAELVKLGEARTLLGVPLLRQPAKEQAPGTAPERAPLAPKLDPVTDIVEADDPFFGMVSLTDNAEILHLEAGRGQLFHGCFRCLMVCEDRDDCVSCFHLILFRCRNSQEGPGYAAAAMPAVALSETYSALSPLGPVNG